MRNCTKTNNNILNIYLMIYVIYMIMITFTGFTSYAPYLHLIYKLLIIISIIINLIFLSIIHDKNGNKGYIDYILLIITIFVLLLNFILNIQIIPPSLIAIYLFIANLRYVNLNSFIRCDFKAKLFLLILLIFLYIIHLTPDQSFLNGMNIHQISAGFTNYNGFSDFLLYLFISYILFINKRSYRKKFISIFFIFSLLIFMITSSRGFIFASIIIALLLFLGKNLFVRKIVRIFTIPILILCTIFAIYLPFHININTNAFNYFNKFLSGRLILQYVAARYTPIRLTGDINFAWLKSFSGMKHIPIDNSYLILLLASGVIGLIIFEILLLKVSYNAIRYNRYLLCVVLISLFVYITIESPISNINFYVPIIYACILSHEKKIKSKLEE